VCGLLVRLELETYFWIELPVLSAGSQAAEFWRSLYEGEESVSKGIMRPCVRYQRRISLLPS